MRLLSCLLLCGLCALSFAAAPPARTPPRWLKLIDQLGDDADARSAAEKKLAALGEDVLPALRRATKAHPDTDARLRAALLVAAIEKRLYGLARSFPVHGVGAIHFALSPDAKYVATSAGWKGDDRVIRVWKVADGAKKVDLEGHRAPVYALAWSGDGKRILSGDIKGILILWDAKGRKLKTLQAPDVLNSVALTHDGKRAVTSGVSRYVSVWDLEAGKDVASNSDHEAGVRTVRLMPDGKHVVTAGLDGTIRLIDVATARQARKMAVKHKGGAQLAVPSPDGAYVASGGVEGAVYLCDVKTGKLVREFTGHDKGVHAIAFSRDGRRLITGGYDRALRVWDVATGRLLQRFDDAHLELITDAAVLPDGAVLTSGYDRPMKVWKVRK